MTTITDTYVPPRHGKDWEAVDPAAAGFDAGSLAEAVAFLEAHDSPWAEDLADDIRSHMHEPAPFNTLLGPVAPRGGPAGVLLRGGRIVAEWGDTGRADMTFSVTKSALSCCAGLAFDDGLIPDLHAPVRDLVDDGGYEPPHNHKITWHQLLQQTSEWDGTLWDRPDWIDHNRGVAGADDSLKGQKRDLQAPGTYWEYNDVRVNRASLSVMRVWRRPLPDLFAERIMNPIGASDGWRWNGYANSKVMIDGVPMEGVSGGGHWGGGMVISARDMARIGLLMLRRGRWQDRQLLSERWIDLATTPCEINPSYGYMWWLNAAGQQAPAASRDAYFARGMGSHVLWVDPANDLVCAIRWVHRDAVADAIKRIISANRIYQC